MAKGMKLRDVEAALTRHGCRVKRDDGNHTVWACPCGEHMASIPRHREVSPGVVRKEQRRMACLPEGWLQ